MQYLANSQRYQTMEYRRCGNSGLKLPAHLAYGTISGISTYWKMHEIFYELLLIKE